VASSSIQTEPIVQLFTDSHRIADFHIRLWPTILALHANKVLVLAVPLGRGAVASVFVAHVFAGQILELDARAPVEAGKAGVRWTADFVLVFTCNAGVTLRLEIPSVHVARAFAMLAFDVRLGEEGDCIGEGAEQVSIIRRS